tara:strand:+ start:2828 stop:3094 length:267 start_codon:yes stop_codon:yes gene_type:complete
MKFTKNTWKEFINEAKDPEYISDEEYTEYERDDISTDHKMVFLLEEILSQLKILNHHMTPAKDIGTSGVEKAMADISVTEHIETPDRK